MLVMNIEQVREALDPYEKIVFDNSQSFIERFCGGFRQFLDLAVDQLAFASCAATDAATVREVNALSECGLQQGLFGLHGDGEPVDRCCGRFFLRKERKHAFSGKSKDRSRK